MASTSIIQVFLFLLFLPFIFNGIAGFYSFINDQIIKILYFLAIRCYKQPAWLELNFENDGWIKAECAEGVDHCLVATGCNASTIFGKGIYLKFLLKFENLYFSVTSYRNCAFNDSCIGIGTSCRKCRVCDTNYCNTGMAAVFISSKLVFFAAFMPILLINIGIGM